MKKKLIGAVLFCLTVYVLLGLFWPKPFSLYYPKVFWNLKVEGLDNEIYIMLDLDVRTPGEKVVLATVENGEWVLVKMDWPEEGGGIGRGSYNYGKDPTGEEIGIKIYDWCRDLRVTVPWKMEYWNLTVEGLDNEIYITTPPSPILSPKMAVLATVENGEWVLVKMDWPEEGGIGRGSYNYGKDPTGEEIGIKIYGRCHDLRVTVPSETKIEVLLPALA